MTNEEKIALADKVLEQKAKQKAYDRWYLAKAKHNLSELERIVKDHGLEGEIEDFGKTIEDFTE